MDNLVSCFVAVFCLFFCFCCFEWENNCCSCWDGFLSDVPCDKSLKLRVQPARDGAFIRGNYNLIASTCIILLAEVHVHVMLLFIFARSKFFNCNKFRRKEYFEVNLPATEFDVLHSYIVNEGFFSSYKILNSQNCQWMREWWMKCCWSLANNFHNQSSSFFIKTYNAALCSTGIVAGALITCSKHRTTTDITIEREKRRKKPLISTINKQPQFLKKH